MDLQTLKQQFMPHFSDNGQPIRMFFAPGRVNLIGEHTDHNGGLVFPAALTFGTYMLIRRRADDVLHLASGNFKARAEISLKDLSYQSSHDWMNYPKAVIDTLKQKGKTFHGYDVYYWGNIPGGGLSSSASIQLVTGYGFEKMEGRKPDRVELALLAQKSENEYMGVQCGIMDQFTVAMGETGHALLLDCSTLSFERVPVQAGAYKVLIGNTNKSRGLVDSAYNKRRKQCEIALEKLKTVMPHLAALAHMKPDEFAEHGTMIEDPVIYNRAKHVIEENHRVKQSVESLKRGDLSQFGRYMTESHESLRDLYEVSCKELDVMVDELLKHDGVLGARMTGAGFGGCTVSIVHEANADQVIDSVSKAYEEKTGLTGEFYLADIGDGVREIDL